MRRGIIRQPKNTQSKNDQREQQNKWHLKQVYLQMDAFIS